MASNATSACAAGPPQPLHDSGVFGRDTWHAGPRAGAGMGGMSEAEIERRMAELDRLLNDPDVRMDADRVWTLLAEITRGATGPRLRG